MAAAQAAARRVAEAIGRQAAALGVRGLALPAFELDSIGERVEWAKRVVAIAREQAVREPAVTGSPA